MNDFSLTQDELRNFHKNGFIGPFTLYNPDEMQTQFNLLRRELLDTKNAVYQGKNTVNGVTNLVNYDRHLDIPFLLEHICKKKIVDRICSILGNDVLCWRTEFFPKYPGDEGTDWHQVKNFSAISKTKKPNIQWPQHADFCGSINVWSAFTESTVNNGCLRFIPGTHGVSYYDESKKMLYDKEKINHIEKQGQKKGFFGYDFSELQIDSNWMPDESKAVALEMRPGQFIIFWSTLLHASFPHSGQTSQMRLGYTARYVPTSVQIYPHIHHLEAFDSKVSLENYRAILVSGNDAFKHNSIQLGYPELN